ncbi:MAG TPA: CBS domain-containing protein, partial [Chitinophagaceae bacterium]|nr:CBS domain-containing protein [Chitinophagaceae bacterium]
MLTHELLSQTIPFLRLSDKVYQALELMNENNVTHLPVVNGSQFSGLISEDDLLQAENDNALL